jgi:hypothetical protein
MHGRGDTAVESCLSSRCSHTSPLSSVSPSLRDATCSPLMPITDITFPRAQVSLFVAATALISAPRYMLLGLRWSCRPALYRSSFSNHRHSFMYIYRVKYPPLPPKSHTTRATPTTMMVCHLIPYRAIPSFQLTAPSLDRVTIQPSIFSI